MAWEGAIRFAGLRTSLFLLLVLVGCGGGPERRRPEQAAHVAVPVSAATGRVPAEPPDSEPAWFSADTMWTSDMPESPFPVLKNIVSVTFTPSATQAERQAAIDLVHGKVVGGSRVARFYWILLPDDPTGHTMRRALELLQGLPQVRGAGFDVTAQPAKRRRN